jgi:hypothetical protein
LPPGLAGCTIINTIATTVTVAAITINGSCQCVANCRERHEDASTGVQA